MRDGGLEVEFADEREAKKALAVTGLSLGRL